MLPNRSTVFGNNRQYITGSPIKNLGSPMRKASTFDIEQNQKLMDYYNKEIPIKETELFEILQSIQKSNDELSLYYGENVLLKKKKSSLQKQIKNLLKEMEIIEIKLNEKNQKINEELEDELNEYKKKFKEIKFQIIKELEVSKKNYQEKLNKLIEIKSKNYQDEINLLIKDNEKIQNDTKNYNKEKLIIYNKRQNELNDLLKLKIEGFSTTLKNANDKLIEKELLLTNINDSYTNLLKSSQDQINNLQKIEQTISNLQYNTENISKNLNNITDEKSMLSKRNQDKLKQLKELEKKFNEKKLVEKNLQGKLNDESLIKSKILISITELLKKKPVYLNLKIDHTMEKNVNGFEKLSYLQKDYWFLKIFETNFFNSLLMILKNHNKSNSNSLVIFGDYLEINVLSQFNPNSNCQLLKIAENLEDLLIEENSMEKDLVISLKEKIQINSQIKSIGKVKYNDKINSLLIIYENEKIYYILNLIHQKIDLKSNKLINKVLKHLYENTFSLTGFNLSELDEDLLNLSQIIFKN